MHSKVTFFLLIMSLGHLLDSAPSKRQHSYLSFSLHFISLQAHCSPSVNARQRTLRWMGSQQDCFPKMTASILVLWMHTPSTEGISGPGISLGPEDWSEGYRLSHKAPGVWQSAINGGMRRKAHRRVNSEDSEKSS